MRKVWAFPLMAAKLVALAVAGPALGAEEQDSQSRQAEDVLEEIYVTARKRVEPLQSAPVASTVISGQNLELGFKTDLNSLAFAAPNVNISMADYWSNIATVSVRGQVQYDVESSYDPPVGIFVDGVYIPRNAANSLDLFDVEAIEVLRGPQGTLFGRNTSAGALQIRTRRPSGEFGMRGSFDVGGYGRANLKTAIEFPVVQDKVSAKVAVMSYSLDGYFDSMSQGEDLGRQDILAIRPTVVFTPSEKFDLTLIGEYSENTSENTPGQNDSDATKVLCIAYQRCRDSGGDPFVVDMDWPGEIDNETKGITVEANWRVDAGTVTLIANHRKMDDVVDINGDNTTAFMYHLTRDQPHKQSSAEMRFVSKGWDRLDLIGGLYFFSQEYDIYTDAFVKFDPSTPIPNALHIYNNAGQEHDSFSVFGEADYRVSDRLTLTLGGRWSKDEKEFYAYGFGLYPNVGANLGTHSESWDDFGPKAGVQYQFTPDLMTYFTYSRGFKSGGYDGRCLTVPTCERAFDPEKTDSFEVGLKADFLDNRLRTNIAVFLQDVKDLQRTVIVPLAEGTIANETVTDNAATAQINGVELELSWLIAEGLRIDYALGYLDAEYDEFCADLDGPSGYTAPPSSSCGGILEVGDVEGDGLIDYLVDEDFSSRKMQRAPKTSHALNLTYQYPLGNWGTMVLNGRYTKVSKLFTDVTEISPRKAIDLLDASASFEDAEGRYRLSFYGKNLTDEVYTTGRNLAANFWTARYLNPPRQFGVEVAFNL